MIISDLFVAPIWCLVLLTLPAIWGWMKVRDRRQEQRLEERIGPRAPELVRSLEIHRRRDRRRLTLAGLGCITLALMQPVWGEGQRASTGGADLMICLDTSRSMLARDMDPDRLESARADILELVDELGPDRVGLVAFAGSATLVAPLTRDFSSFRGLVESVDLTTVSEGGSDLGAAVTLALESLADSKPGRSAVIVLSDGESHGGAVDQKGAAQVPVHGLGYGTEFGSKIPVLTAGGETFLQDAGGNDVVTRLEPTALKALVSRTGGVYAAASSKRSPVAGLFRSVVKPQARRVQRETGEDSRKPRFQWPLFFAFVLLCLELSWGDRRLR